ncbi:DUF1614 domain-containing protein [Sulfurirhabdus autotrophica]|uniref:Putative membrane protein n=1 Tax=Sulfurirhabdus autotrophica TaxID=1706046 RepID=A0A4R3XVY4_9PROT|nr:DUF1614 domain-containing protein [Sulfurirhabdus autotrophica]TCV82971.1 putative membrane protein [Sulfurirhabdus autotrophica]
MPKLPPRMILLFALLAFLVTFVQLNIITIAFDKLGLSSHSAYLLFMVTLLGSFVNLPLLTVKNEAVNPELLLKQFRQLFRQANRVYEGKTVVVLNVGGGLVPMMFSGYLLVHNPISLYPLIIATAGVTAISYLFSRPLPGIGIGMPIFVAPVTAAFLAVALSADQSAPLAYIAGTMGVLIGADLLRLKEIKKMGTPVASIGGAGTFDGIFLTGIVAVLLT